jgi:hypothetical protein
MLSSLMYYAQSFKTGLAANKRALAGLIFGTAIYTLFRSRQRNYSKQEALVTLYSGLKQKRSFSLGF